MVRIERFLVYIWVLIKRTKSHFYFYKIYPRQTDSALWALESNEITLHVCPAICLCEWTVFPFSGRFWATGSLIYTPNDVALVTSRQDKLAGQALAARIHRRAHTRVDTHTRTDGKLSFSSNKNGQTVKGNQLKTKFK